MTVKVTSGENCACADQNCKGKIVLCTQKGVERKKKQLTTTTQFVGDFSERRLLSFSCPTPPSNTHNVTTQSLIPALRITPLAKALLVPHFPFFLLASSPLSLSLVLVTHSSSPALECDDVLVVVVLTRQILFAAICLPLHTYKDSHPKHTYIHTQHSRPTSRLLPSTLSSCCWFQKQSH